MKCLVRRILRKSSSGEVHQDDVHDSDALSIGRAAGQQLFLPDMHVALEHAVIRPLSPGKFTLQARGGNPVQINGRILQLATISVGDEIQLGHFTLHVFKPPAGYDLALQIESPGEDAKRSRRSVGATSLKAAGISARPWAWLLFLLVLAGSLGLPLYHGLKLNQRQTSPGLSGQGTPPSSATTPRPATVASMLAVLPNAGAWSPGALSNYHHFIGNDCARCHTLPFRRVDNAACLTCHMHLPAHADTKPALQMATLATARCTACHQEHLGTAALVSAAEHLCTACHGDPKHNMPGSQLPLVHDFGGDHPEFRVAVLTLSNEWQFSTHLASLATSGLKRNTGLKYPHDLHLKATGIKRADGTIEILQCRSCHVPDTAKVGFAPQTFAAQCQRCHRLTFEPTDPSLELPHGNAATVWQFLQGYYAQRALAGGYTGKGTSPEVAEFRRPGTVLSPRTRKAALAWANRKAADVAREVFDYRLCVTCHTLRYDTGKAVPWTVAPVMQQFHWFPEAAFSHAAHGTMNCDECHAARTSKHITEVLMPHITTCQRCHGGTQATLRVPSTCITCHGFHKALRHGMDGKLIPVMEMEKYPDAHPG